jgi:hypothetical protein
MIRAIGSVNNQPSNGPQARDVESDLPQGCARNVLSTQPRHYRPAVCRLDIS